METKKNNKIEKLEIVHNLMKFSYKVCITFITDQLFFFSRQIKIRKGKYKNTFSIRWYCKRRIFVEN